ncbi:hypothetical protein M2271_006129 [Streptomyces sp. LBL]|nr:hypothetical protein [Streptomyces sp. LBL]
MFLQVRVGSRVPAFRNSRWNGGWNAAWHRLGSSKHGASPDSVIGPTQLRCHGPRFRRAHPHATQHDRDKADRPHSS